VYTERILEPNKLDDDHRKTLKKNNGWDYTKNSVKITLCCERKGIVDKLKEKMRNFEQWNEKTANPTKMRTFNGSEPNQYAAFTPSGSKFLAGDLTGVADGTMYVELNRKPENPSNGAVLEAITLDDHPLIGARRWGVSEKGNTITIWTESYDIGRNWIVQQGLETPESTQDELKNSDQFNLWEVYLDNLASTIDPKCVLNKKKNDIEFKRVPGVHPWRKDLR
jgi:hypothetical protein